MGKINPAEVAREFWQACSVVFPDAEFSFPRRFDLWLPAALPVSVVRIHQLTPRSASEWALRAGLALPLPDDNRPVRGCLVAARGNGLIFVDENDGDDELQFTLAHESAHFICHYHRPRRHASARLGPGITEVLDGLRDATPEEKLAGVLRGCPIGQYRHLLDRGSGGGFSESRLAQAERDADLVAFELMVPAKEVRAMAFRAHGNANRRSINDILTRYYQLPPWAANAYGMVLFRRSLSGEDTWLGGIRRVIEDTVEK